MLLVYLLGGIILFGLVFAGVRRSTPVPAEHREHAPPVDFSLLRDCSTVIEELGQQGAQFSILFGTGSPRLSLQEVKSYLERHWPNLKPVAETPGYGSEKRLATSCGQLQFELTRATPISGGLGQALEHNALWPEAGEMVGSHEWCIVVSARVGGMGLDHSIALSQAVGAMVATCPQVIGALWATASHVVSRATLLSELSQDFDRQLPLGLWISAKAFRDTDGRTVGYTQGLALLGRTEFEALDAPEEPDALRGRLIGLAGYALVNGCDLQNGDTVGKDSEETVFLRKRPSETVNSGWVFQLEYPGWR